MTHDEHHWHWLHNDLMITFEFCCHPGCEAINAKVDLAVKPRLDCMGPEASDED